MLLRGLLGQRSAKIPAFVLAVCCRRAVDHKIVGRHIIITDEDVYVFAPYKVHFLTAGCLLSEDGSVDCTQVGGRKVIVMSK